MSTTSENLMACGLKPIGYDRLGPKYALTDVMDGCLRDIQTGNHFNGRDKKMSLTINEASDVVEDATKKFYKVFEKMMDVESKASSEAKKVSGNVRKAADDLAQGLIKVQKTADFASLERHVVLLERAASALTVLSSLDKDGRLEKLIKAMK